MSEFKLSMPSFILQDGKFWKLNPPVLIGEQQNILKRIGSELPYNIVNAFQLPGEIQANIQCKGEMVIVWSELKKLRINTVYTETESGIRYPVFKREPESSPPEHNASYDFLPSSVNMRMYFTSTMVMEAKNYKWTDSFLICKAPRRKEIFRPPLPNIHGDARICMGDFAYVGPCLADVYTRSVNHLFESRWNSDLMTGLTPDHLMALYSFKSGAHVPPPKEYKWWENRACSPVSTSHYNELPLV